MGLLEQLRGQRGLLATCPSCGDEFRLADARLFDATKRLPDYARAYLAEQHASLKKEQVDLRARRRQTRPYRIASEMARDLFTNLLAAPIGGLFVIAWRRWLHPALVEHIREGTTFAREKYERLDFDRGLNHAISLRLREVGWQICE